MYVHSFSMHPALKRRYVRIITKHEAGGGQAPIYVDYRYMLITDVCLLTQAAEAAIYVY